MGAGLLMAVELRGQLTRIEFRDILTIYVLR